MNSSINNRKVDAINVICFGCLIKLFDLESRTIYVGVCLYPIEPTLRFIFLFSPIREKNEKLD